MSDAWEWVRPFITFALFCAAIGAALFANWPLSFGILFVLFLWGMLVSSEEHYKAEREWEEEYEAMPVDEKIDYHLRRARRYHSNVDANIAQALIKRNR